MSRNDWTSKHAVRQTKARWVLAHEIAEVLGVGARVAWDWIRTLRREGVDLGKLCEADVEQVDLARAIMATLERLAPKTQWVSPLVRSTRRAFRFLVDPADGYRAGSARARTQIMLWAIGRCGSISDARKAFEKAISLIDDHSRGISENVWARDEQKRLAVPQVPEPTRED